MDDLIPIIDFKTLISDHNKSWKMSTEFPPSSSLSIPRWATADAMPHEVLGFFEQIERHIPDQGEGSDKDKVETIIQWYKAYLTRKAFIIANTITWNEDDEIAPRFTVGEHIFFTNTEYFHVYEWHLVSIKADVIPSPMNVKRVSVWNHFELVKRLCASILKLYFFLDLTARDDVVAGTLTEEVLGRFLDEGEHKKLWRYLGQRRSDMKDKMLTDASSELMEVMKAMGRWPAGSCGEEERRNCWEKAFTKPAMEVLCSRIAHVIDLEEIMMLHHIQNRKLKAFCYVLFSGGLEARWHCEQQMARVEQQFELKLAQVGKQPLSVQRIQLAQADGRVDRILKATGG